MRTPCCTGWIPEPFVFFLVMAVLTSVIKSGVALLFLFAFFIAMWCTCRIQKYILVLAGKLKVLLAFIFLLWLILGLFGSSWRQFRAIPYFETMIPFVNGQSIHFCFDWYDLYKGAVYSLRIFLLGFIFYAVLPTHATGEIILGLQKWRISYALAFGIGLIFQIIPMIITELNAIMGLKLQGLRLRLRLGDQGEELCDIFPAPFIPCYQQGTGDFPGNALLSAEFRRPQIYLYEGIKATKYDALFANDQPNNWL